MTEKEQFSKHDIVYGPSRVGKSRLMAELAVANEHLVEYPSEWRSNIEDFISRKIVETAVEASDEET